MAKSLRICNFKLLYPLPFLRILGLLEDNVEIQNKPKTLARCSPKLLGVSFSLDKQTLRLTFSFLLSSLTDI